MKLILLVPKIVLYLLVFLVQQLLNHLRVLYIIRLNIVGIFVAIWCQIYIKSLVEIKIYPSFVKLGVC